MMEGTFNIEEVKIAESYDPNDPFSPLPPAPEPVKIYENLNDILIRTSREQHQQDKLELQRQRRRQGEKDRRQRRKSELRGAKSLANDASKVPESVKLKNQQDLEVKPNVKTFSRYVELKQTMKEMYYQPQIRPTTSDSNRPNKIAKKPQAPKRHSQQELDNFFDFIPINTRRDNKLKMSKDIKPSIEIKKEPRETANSSNSFEYVDDDVPPVPNNHQTGNRDRISATEKDHEISLPHATQQLVTTDNFDDEPVNVKIEFEDTFIKDEPIDEDYCNQPATSYDENAAITAESLRDSIMQDIEDRNAADATQMATKKRVEVGCRIEENFDYDRVLHEEDDDNTGVPDMRYVEVEGFIKEELSAEDYFV